MCCWPIQSIFHTDDDFSRDDIIITFRAFFFPTNPRAGPPLAKSLPVTAIEPSGEAQERGGLGYKQPYIMEADMASHYLPLPHVRGIKGDTQKDTPLPQTYLPDFIGTDPQVKSMTPQFLSLSLNLEAVTARGRSTFLTFPSSKRLQGENCNKSSTFQRF